MHGCVDRLSPLCMVWSMHLLCSSCSVVIIKEHLPRILVGVTKKLPPYCTLKSVCKNQSSSYVNRFHFVPCDYLVVVPAKLFHVATWKYMSNDVNLVSVLFCLQELFNQPLQLTCWVCTINQQPTSKEL